MASYGIHGAVDNYADLPDAGILDLNTVFLVRQDAGAPSGAGLYWVRKDTGGKAWAYLDGLSMQRADEVPFDGEAAGLPYANLQEAVAGALAGAVAREPLIVHVSATAGDDATADGSPGKPFATLAAAALSIPDPEDTTEMVTPVILRLAPGVYTGDVRLPRRKDVTVEGLKTRIEGNLLWDIHFADWHLTESEFRDPLHSFDIKAGLTFRGLGPGTPRQVEAAGLVIDGDIVYQPRDIAPEVTAIVFPSANWIHLHNVSIQGHFPIVGMERQNKVLARNNVYGHGNAVVLTLTHAQIGNEWAPAGIIGGDRFLGVEAVDSYLCGEIRRQCQFMTMNNVVIGSIDTLKDLDGNPATGGVSMGSGGFPGFSGCTFVGDTYDIHHGKLRLDASSAASLLEKSPAGDFTLSLMDPARHIAYNGADGQTGVWDGDVPGDLQEAVRRIAVALQTQTGTPIA